MRNQTITLHNSLKTQEIDGVYVVYQPETGLCYQLNDMGQAIFMALAKPTPYLSLLSQLSRTYQINIKDCEADLTPYLNFLYDKALIKLNLTQAI
jgi:hypothetical protein